MSDSLDQFIAASRNLPALPAQIGRLLHTLDDPNRSARDFERIVVADPTLSAQLLKLANSVFYSRQEKVVTLSMALVRLGQKTVKSLILTVWTQTLRRFAKREDELALVTRLLTHGTACGVASRLLMRARARGGEEEAFVAGLLHDIGRVALICQMGLNYGMRVLDWAAAEGRDLREAETERNGFDHGQLGARLMRSWNLPPLYAETAERHHDANLSPETDPVLCAVALADKLVTDMGYNVVPEAPRMCRDDLASHFKIDELPEFRENCREETERMLQALSSL